MYSTALFPLGNSCCEPCCVEINFSRQRRLHSYTITLLLPNQPISNPRKYFSRIPWNRYVYCDGLILVSQLNSWRPLRLQGKGNCNHTFGGAQFVVLSQSEVTVSLASNASTEKICTFPGAATPRLSPHLTLIPISHYFDQQCPCSLRALRILCIVSAFLFPIQPHTFRPIVPNNDIPPLGASSHLFGIR